MATPNRTLAELTTTTQTSAWIPRDVYAKGVLMALYSERKLGLLAAARRFDIKAGEGNTVKVKTVGKRTAQGPIAEGASLAANAGTFSTVAVTIEKFGDRDDLTDEAITQSDDDVVGVTLAGFGLALNEKIEQKAYDTLFAAAGTRTTTLDAKGVVDYEEVLKAEAAFTAGYKPDTLIVHRTHKSALLLDPALEKSVDYNQGEIVLPGEIGRIGNIRIIVHDLANAKDTATVNEVQAIMLDSSRAFVEAFGKPLRFKMQEVIESDQYKHVAWMWYGVAVADANAICHLKNAAV